MTKQSSANDRVPDDWLSFAQLTDTYKCGSVTLAHVLPVIRSSLVCGMVEAGASLEMADNHIEKEFITYETPSIKRSANSYLSPKIIAIMKESGLIKNRWIDSVKRDSGPSLP